MNKPREPNHLAKLAFHLDCASSSLEAFVDQVQRLKMELPDDGISWLRALSLQIDDLLPPLQELAGEYAKQLKEKLS